MRKKLHLGLGYLSVALAVLGLALPLLPTTPFLLVAVWAFARSDPELAAKLYGHPRFGALLTAWRDQGAIPLRAKLVALAALAASGALTIVYVGQTALSLIVLGILCACGLYLATRPTPRGP